MTARRLQACSGLAAAVIPFAIVIHLAAEFAALGGDRIDASFILRHGYFGLLFVASVAWFSATVGLGRSPRERRRRCALVEADLRATPPLRRLLMLVGANLIFFASTQLVEGVPIASGAVGLALAVALFGSTLAALAVFSFGRTLLTATLECVLATSPARPAAACARIAPLVVPRTATSAYSLFVPNRPPPNASRSSLFLTSY